MKRRQVIVIAGVLLLLTVVLICSTKGNNEPDLFHIEVQTVAGTERITPWVDEQGRIIVFLPSYADLADTKLCLHTETPVLIGGIRLSGKTSCESVSLGVACELEYSVFGRQQKREMVFVRSANLAAMYIDTESESTEYIHGKKGRKESGKLKLYDSDGVLDYTGELLSLEGRGNTTWRESEKKPYNMTLAQRGNLLGLGVAEKWTLLANALDDTHIRNKLAFDFAKAVDLSFSPDSEWVDLYLNGEYAGLYLLSERIEVHPERVNISQQSGFLVDAAPERQLLEKKVIYFATQSGQAVRVRYPVQPTEEELHRLAEEFQAVENALVSENGIDPESGKHWSEFIDLDSWAKKYLLEEMFGNTDGCRVSHYFYRDGDEQQKIYAGPVWDYDLSMGNDKYEFWSIADPNVSVIGRYDKEDDRISNWIEALRGKAAFWTRIYELFEQEFSPMLDLFLEERLPAYAQMIGTAADLNRIRWGGQSIQEAVEQMECYLENHALFLRDLWLKKAEYCQIGFTGLACDTFYTVLPGERLEKMPTIAYREPAVFQGLYYANTHEPFDITRPIAEDTLVYAKWEFKSTRMEELIPSAVISVLGVIMLLIEIRRMKRNR